VTRLLIILLQCASFAAAQRMCDVSGRVTEEGKPLPGATVTALTVTLGQPPRVLNGDVSDARGSFCIRELPAGSYLIRASVRTQTPSSSPDCSTCCEPTTEFPVWESSKPVQVKGGTITVNVPMRRVAAFCVRGEVRGREGSLRDDVMLSLNAGPWSAGVFNQGGRFLLTALPASTYVLTISHMGRDVVQQPVHVKSNIDGLVVKLP